ncbi:hypothetical protein KAW80_02900 [Candidatus Babeliales bacterium]|nr:hypothetical protein [Candidatus Babeliales bacterium]
MKKGLIATLVGVGVFLFLGVPYIKMGFDSDCFGFVEYCSRFKSLSEFWASLFKPIQEAYAPLNELQFQIEKPSFLGTYYRPLGTILYFICYKLFGFNAYGFFLIHILLHAFTASFVFLIFTFFLENLWAVLLSLVFALHPALVPSYIGLTCELLPVYFFLGLSILCYGHYLKSDKFFYYLFSNIFFLLSLFSYELPLIVPFIVLFYLIVFDYNQIVKRSLLFFSTVFIYLFLRYLILGGGLGKFISSQSGLLNLKNRFLAVFFNWHQAIKPFWGMQQMSKLFVAALTFLFIVIVCFNVIYRKPDRKKIIFYVGAFFMASWNIFLGSSCTRYFYIAVVFFALILFEVIKFLSLFIKISKRKNFIAAGLILFILWGGYHASYSLTRRELYTSMRDNAYFNLAKKYKNQDVKLVYLGFLHCYNDEIFLMQSGVTQASRIFFNNPDLLAYHVIQSKFYSKTTTNKNFEIIPADRGYRFVSPDPENLFIMSSYKWQEGNFEKFSMGHFVVNRKQSGWQAADMTFIFDEKWLGADDLRKTIFVTWDMVNWRLKELNKDHLRQ